MMYKRLTWVLSPGRWKSFIICGIVRKSRIGKNFITCTWKNMITVIKAQRVRRVRHIAYMGEM
jgi:hypothetical protein